MTHDRPDRDTIPGVSTSQRRSPAGRPFRRLKRWARHTPNGVIALNMVCGGLALIVIALILALVLL